MLQEMQFSIHELTLHRSLGQSLKQFDAIEIPFRGAKQAKGVYLQLYVGKHRNPHASYLLYTQLHVTQAHQGGIKLPPESIHALITGNLALKQLFQTHSLLLAFLHLEPQCRLLALDDGQGALTHLQILLQLLK